MRILVTGSSGHLGEALVRTLRAAGHDVLSATTPFGPGDLHELRGNAPAVVRRPYPDYEEAYARRG
jgi:uncharacterized protein YbjT (DUF2867 family)